MILFFHPYYKNKPIENVNHEIWMGHPLFPQKLWVETAKSQVSLETTKASAEWGCFSIYIKKLTPLENERNEFCMGHPSLRKKMGLKPQKCDFSLRAIKTNV